MESQAAQNKTQSDDACGSDRACAADQRAELDKDAVSSNTASNSYIPDLSFRPLRWGVDSLYLSYPGELSFEADKSLQHLKKIAQSPEPYQQYQAQMEVGGHILEVKDKGAPLFPYVLEDRALRIQLSRPGRKTPMAYVKLSSGHLNHLGPAEAETGLKSILEGLGELHDEAHVSRIDLYVDFVSNVPMDSWGRESWVTRAGSISNYSEGGTFTGWMVGAGGVVSFRLYNKTQEIKKSHKDYLLPLWRQCGWDGEMPVWRAEFQYRRQVLDQFGLVRLSSTLRNLGSLWGYATGEWLRLSIPDPTDSNRSRWAIHPLWVALGSIDWDTPGGPLSPRFSFDRSPSNHWIFRQEFSAITSYMAKHAILDFEQGRSMLLQELYNHFYSVSMREGIPFDQFVEEKVRAKGRRYNTIFNLDEIPDEDRKRMEIDEAASAYSRASRG